MATVASSQMAPRDVYGYLLVHFREGEAGERVYFSLSEPRDPLSWRALRGGDAVLSSTVGTQGVRDPVIVRGIDGVFHILATDLHAEADRSTWPDRVRFGSRSIVVWDSPDLMSWGPARAVEIAPPNAGMAWAPDAIFDRDTGEHIVFWSSRLYDTDDPSRSLPSYSRILFSRTRDFVTFTDAEVMIDTGRDVIDTAIARDGEIVHRISKDEEPSAGGLGVYHEVGTGSLTESFETVSVRIGADRYPAIEAPILFRDDSSGRWYLFLDQYTDHPQGYVAFETDDVRRGRWRAVSPECFRLRPGTKHGGVLPLSRAEWERLASAEVGSDSDDPVRASAG